MYRNSTHYDQSRSGHSDHVEDAVETSEVWLFFLGGQVCIVESDRSVLRVTRYGRSRTKNKVLPGAWSTSSSVEFLKIVLRWQRSWLLLKFLDDWYAPK